MRNAAIVVFLIATMFASSAVYAFDVCSLISPTEMAAAIGEAVSSSSPGSRGEEDAPGVKTWDCQYWKGKTPIAVVTVQQFPSSEAVRRHIEELKRQVTELDKDVSPTQLLEERISGEPAIMTIDDEAGVTFNSVKQTRFLSIAVGQEHPNVDKLRASLKQLAAKAMAKF